MEEENFFAKTKQWVTDGETILHPADKFGNCQVKVLKVQKS